MPTKWRSCWYSNAVLQNLTKQHSEAIRLLITKVTNDFTRFCRFPSLIIVLKKTFFPRVVLSAYEHQVDFIFLMNA